VGGAAAGTTPPKRAAARSSALTGSQRSPRLWCGNLLLFLLLLLPHRPSKDRREEDRPREQHFGSPEQSSGSAVLQAPGQGGCAVSGGVRGEHQHWFPIPWVLGPE